MRTVSRTVAIAAAVAIQSLLIAGAVAPRLSAHVAGDDYLVRVEPVDPIDPLRGAYVRLGYPDLAISDYRADLVGAVYLPLVRDGELWRGGGPRRDRPEAGPYIACRYDGVLRCGIESLFADQAEARELERDLAEGGAVATIRVDRRGNAVVLGIRPA